MPTKPARPAPAPAPTPAPTPAATSALAPAPSWPDEHTRSSLQLIADGVTELAGFQIAIISIAGEDDRLHVAAVSGNEDARRALTGTATPLDVLREELARADTWGLFQFVPAERLEGAGAEAWGWVPDVERAEVEDAWDPLDLLIAPLVDADGVLRGTLSIDLPVDGRRPDPERRRLLDRHAEAAGRALVTALERHRLAEQVRLAGAAREIVRRAASRTGLHEALDSAAATLLESFGVVAVSTWVFGEETAPRTTYAGPEESAPWDPGLAPFGPRIAERLWARQDVAVFGRSHRRNIEGTPEEVAYVERYLEEHGIDSMLCAAMGAGGTALGVLTLLRGAGAPPWTDVEYQALLEIGRDLGNLLHSDQALRKQRELAHQLKDLDSAKSQLVATFSHELKSPLTAITANLELLDGEPDDDLTAPALAAVRRGAERLVRLVDGLRAFSRVGELDAVDDRVPVDLVGMVKVVRDLTAGEAARRGVSVVVDAPSTPVLATGNPHALDHVVVNLVSNALKYTPAGGTVTLAVRCVGDEVELAVTDTGIGIFEQDLPRLFTEFFRSSDPAVRAEPGSGLGLAIVDRTVRGHGGSIEVESTPGVGSTFRVRLPWKDAP